MKNFLMFVFAVLMYVPGFAQQERSLVRRGNRDYEKEHYQDAEINYRKALETNPLMEEGNYNLGNSLYSQNKYEEAVTTYNDVAKRGENEEIRNNSTYNLGNALYQSKKYAEAVEVYKQYLRSNPDDEDARYNLAMAQQMLKANRQQSGSGGDNQENQQKQDQQQNQNSQQDKQGNSEEQKEQQNSEENQQNQQNQQQQQGQQQQDQQNAQPKEMQISKQDAERMLDAIRNDEKNTLMKVQNAKTKGKKTKIDKDW